MEHSSLKNELLCALDVATYGLLAPYMTRVEFGRGDVFYEPGQPIDRIYFPHAGVISLLSVMEDGSAIEGLYAAGNVSAPVMGHTYAGPGATIGPAITFGYLAALHVAATHPAEPRTPAPEPARTSAPDLTAVTDTSEELNGAH